MRVRCLETRRRNGMKWRRYVTAEGVKVTTYEVPCSVITQLGTKKLAEALRKAEQGLLQRTRKELVKQKLRQGWKPTAIAHDVGITEARVRQIRKELDLT